MDDKRREFVELDLPPKAVLALQRRFGRRWREAVAAALEAEGSRLGAEMGPPEPPRVLPFRPRARE
jgi:hypothetical protein